MRLLDRFHYQRLALSEDGKTQNKSKLRAFFSSYPSYYLIAALLILPATLICLILLIHLLVSKSPQSPHHPRHTSCGTTPSQARSRACHFDILSFAWQTPECYDAELITDFLSYDNWTFYAEFNTTDPTKTVDTATALEGNTGLYVDWKYHVTHCTFMWRQMHRAFTVRGYIDSHLDNYMHTLHCQGTLLDRERDMGGVTVIGMLRYPECREVARGGDGKRRVGGGGY